LIADKTLTAVASKTSLIKTPWPIFPLRSTSCIRDAVVNLTTVKELVYWRGFFRATRRKFALEPTMQEIKLDQRWSEGLKEATVTSVFGVRIEIRWNETNDTDEISEADFRKRFSFVASK
jgi:hypothetical protein